jgi:hypothetical protein
LQLELAFFFQSSHNTVVHQVLRLEATNLFVAGAKEADDVAHAIDAGIDFFLVDADDALITSFNIFDASQAESFRQVFTTCGLFSGLRMKATPSSEALITLSTVPADDAMVLRRVIIPVP